MRILEVGKYNGWSLNDEQGLIIQIPVHAQKIRVSDEVADRLKKKYKLKDVTPKPKKKKVEK